MEVSIKALGRSNRFCVIKNRKYGNNGNEIENLLKVNFAVPPQDELETSNGGRGPRLNPMNGRQINESSSTNPKKGQEITTIPSNSCQPNRKIPGKGALGKLAPMPTLK